MKPEEKARKDIDELLTAAGWVVQDYDQLNLGAGLGVAIREYPLKTGFADYMLFVKRKAVGVVEAKQAGTTLSGVADQSSKYLAGLPSSLRRYGQTLPFAYESTGTETLFRDERDPNFRSRRVFAFHKPETLKDWIEQEETLRSRLQSMPELIEDGLRDCQIEAITGLEKSFAKSRPRALIQMATGSGKTYTAVSFVYRLIKFAGAKRILFLVDRGNLARQTLGEFKQYVTPDDGRKFTELYNVQHLTTNHLDRVNKVCITTIQRLYSMLRGEEDFDGENEEESLFGTTTDGPAKTVFYNSRFPIEDFDFIITDECHRSIYNLWRQVLDYYDAFLIGLTATPSKQTLGFFNKNLVMEYNHQRAVADGVNVPFEVYRIKTQITEQGSTVEAGFHVDKRDRLTRAQRMEQLDEDFSYAGKQLDRSVVAVDQIRTVIRTFHDRLPTEIFPGRSWVPKTLIFAKDDSHAEDIVGIVREEFGKGNEFCKKITYRATGKSEDLIKEFQLSPQFRIAVTVDMIATGTDIKPLECLVFMRDVRSHGFYEQMKGRGTRTIDPTDFKAVTGDGETKTHFILVDAVGVEESKKSDTKPLERKRSVPFKKLLQQVAVGNRDADVVSSLASRLARLDRQLGPEERAEVEAVAGLSLQAMMNGLLGAIDVDRQVERAQADCGTEQPTEAQVDTAAEDLIDEACAPFDRPEVRDLLESVRSNHEQTIDVVSQDVVLFAGYDSSARERAEALTVSFREFIEQNRDEIDALQILFSRPYGERRLTYEQVRELARAIERPPYQFAPEAVWRAYEQLEASKVRGRPEKVLTEIVSLVRFAMGEAAVLEPFGEVVGRRFEVWLGQQEAAGRRFSAEQREWLVMIRDHVATSLAIEAEDFEEVPFVQRGGPLKAVQLFGQSLPGILQELNEVLAA